MSLCHKCNQPVYFAERKTSLGKDWHRACLKCAECGKVLHPGQHAQHRGTPYCDVPCYSALFGPTMFGHGSAVEAHNNFGKQATLVSSPVRKPDLQVKLHAYNDYYEGKNLQIKSKEVNGRLILEGPLRINWGVQTTIKLAEKDESPASKETWRRSYTMAMCNGLDDDFLQALDKASVFATIRTPQVEFLKMGNGGESLLPRRTSLSEAFSQLDVTPDGEDSVDLTQVQTPTRFSTVVIRRDSKRRHRKHRRLSIINGHIFNVETSIFTPAHGSITSVTVTSLDTVPNVIKHLLDKYKVENNPEEFCLCTVKSSGETRVLKEDDFPLLQRVILGPLEDSAKVFIMDKGKVYDVDEDVAQFVNLPDAVLKGFLQKLQEEERKEITMVKLRYHQLRKRLNERLSEFNSTNL